MSGSKVTVAFELSVVLALSACGGGGVAGNDGGHGGAGGTSASGSAGTTGSAGAAGTTGSAGASGAAGAGGAPSPCQPACLTASLTSCDQPSGSCVMDATTGSICYANGVKDLRSVNNAAGTVTDRYVNMDGSICLTETVMITLNNGDMITFADASGATVLTVAIDTTGTEIITCGGRSYDCQPSSTGIGGAGGGGGAQSCSTGTCR